MKSEEQLAQIAKLKHENYIQHYSARYASQAANIRIDNLTIEIKSLQEQLARGDINQGLSSNLEIIRVDGDADGKGFPTIFTLKDVSTGDYVDYIPSPPE